MENIVLESTAKTPRVNFNRDSGFLEISGRSIPENAEKFYHPLINWIDSYVKEPNDSTTINFKFEYFNTSTSKWLITLFKKIAVLHTEGKLVDVNWYYEDEDIFEYAELINELVSIPINKVEIV